MKDRKIKLIKRLAKSFKRLEQAKGKRVAMRNARREAFGILRRIENAINKYSMPNGIKHESQRSKVIMRKLQERVRTLKYQVNLHRRQG